LRDSRGLARFSERGLVEEAPLDERLAVCERVGGSTGDLVVKASAARRLVCSHEGG
jgi:hypothetical protein